MFQNFLSFKFYFTCRNYTVNSGKWNVEFEYLSEFVTEYENNLGYELGAQMRLIDKKCWKNERSKISYYFPFKAGKGAHALILQYVRMCI